MFSLRNPVLILFPVLSFLSPACEEPEPSGPALRNILISELYTGTRRYYSGNNEFLYEESVTMKVEADFANPNNIICLDYSNDLLVIHGTGLKPVRGGIGFSVLKQEPVSGVTLEGSKRVTGKGTVFLDAIYHPDDKVLHIYLKSVLATYTIGYIELELLKNL